jgi:hypothetical protein
MALVALAPVVGSYDKEKDKEKKVVRLLIHAKKTEKLSAELHAVQMSGGTLIGRAARGGVVVEVGAEVAEAAEQRLNKIEAKFTRDKLPKTDKVNRLILTYKKEAKVTAAGLKKKGFELIKRHEAGDSQLFLVEPIAPLNSVRVAGLAKDDDLIHAELDATVRIPPSKAKDPVDPKR